VAKVKERYIGEVLYYGLLGAAAGLVLGAAVLCGRHTYYEILPPREKLEIRKLEQNPEQRRKQAARIDQYYSNERQDDNTLALKCVMGGLAAGLFIWLIKDLS
jgi:hypothetical protein